MASVVGHSLSGVLSAAVFRPSVDHKKRRALILVICLIAILPDFDIIVYMISRFQRMIPHRGISHSLLFALLSALLFFALTHRYLGGKPKRLFLTYLATAVFHPFLDYLMGDGPPVRFFAPFYDAGFLSPVQVIPTAYYSTHFTRLLRLMVYPRALQGYLLEALIFVPLITAATISGREKRSPFLLAALLFCSIAGVGLTILIYRHG